MAGGSCVFAATDIARGRSSGTMNRPGWSNTSTALRVTGKALTGWRVLGERCVQSRPETRARPEFDLCVDVTKLALNIAKCCIGGYLGLSEPHHLLRLLVLYSRAIERECVAVAAIGVGSVLAQPWQRARQLTASLL